MKMTHPQAKAAVEVSDTQVEMYLSQGWREATRDAPPGNASLEAWQEFARSKGFGEDDIAGKSRNDLREALS